MLLLFAQHDERQEAPRDEATEGLDQDHVPCRQGRPPHTRRHHGLECNEHAREQERACDRHHHIAHGLYVALVLRPHYGLRQAVARQVRLVLQRHLAIHAEAYTHSVHESALMRQEHDEHHMGYGLHGLQLRQHGRHQERRRTSLLVESHARDARRVTSRRVAQPAVCARQLGQDAGQGASTRLTVEPQRAG